MKAKIYFFFAMTAATGGACREDPKPDPTPPAPISLPADAPLSPSVEVLIVTQPEEAQILAEGQVLGKTPMKITIREDTNLVLEKEGFVRQAVMLTTKSEPNLVVRLLPSGDKDKSETLAEEKSKRRASRKKDKPAPDPKTDSRISKETKTEPSTPVAAHRPEEEAAKAAVAAASHKPASQKKPARPKLDTMRKCKDAYNNGLITRADYQTATQEIRRRLNEEIDALKSRYRNGEVTKAQYRQQARDIKMRYEG